jgi:hypothetical protein
VASTSILIPAHDAKLEEKLFQIANAVALEAAPKVYSSFHVWEHMLKLPILEDLPEAADSIWDSILPFGHCVSLASYVTKKLRTALEDDSELAPYAPHVQFSVQRLT